MKNSIFLLLIIVIFTGCNSQNKQQRILVRNFYFPYAEFIQGKTYCYENPIDTTDKVYWVMKTQIIGNDTMFITEILDSQKNRTEYLIEKISNNGSILEEYILYFEDIIDTCSIVENTVYNWEMFEGENIVWKVNFPETGSNRTVELAKNRTFVNIDTDKNVINFNDVIKFQALNTNDSYEYQMEFEYTKNIGVTHYKIFTDNELTKEYILWGY